MAFAVVVAVLADALQLLTGPVGWIFFDGAIDVIAMVLTVAALGFHILLLPTFLIELIPVIDAFPTWTGCVLVVIGLRRKFQKQTSPPPKVIVANAEKPKGLPPLARD
jgi:hypothetical protein